MTVAIFYLFYHSGTEIFLSFGQAWPFSYMTVQVSSYAHSFFNEEGYLSLSLSLSHTLSQIIKIALYCFCATFIVFMV